MERLLQKIKNTQGQSTVEFALITIAFIALLIGCGALWRAFDEGLFVEHATKSASHHVDVVYPGAMRDVLLY